MIASIIKHIQQLVPGCTIQAEDIAPLFRQQSVSKGSILLQEGEPCTDIYFVHSGSLYLYYVHDGSKKVIHFALENWWITDYKTFADNRSAVLSIAAMEDTVISAISRKHYNTLLLQYPLLALYFNTIHERAYGAALFKQKTFGTVSPQQFYHQFSHTYAALMQRIPDNIFASYIGVSEEELLVIKQQPATHNNFL